MNTLEVPLPERSFACCLPHHRHHRHLGKSPSTLGPGLNENEGKVAALVRSWNPEFIIALGDNRYGTVDYDSAVGQHFCEFLSETETSSNCSGDEALSSAFFPPLGNHDYTDGGGLDEYLANFTLPGVGLNTVCAVRNPRLNEAVVTFKFFNVEGEIVDAFTMGTVPAP